MKETIISAADFIQWGADRFGTFNHSTLSRLKSGKDNGSNSVRVVLVCYIESKMGTKVVGIKRSFDLRPNMKEGFTPENTIPVEFAGLIFYLKR